VIPQLALSGAEIIYYCHHPDAFLAPRASAWRRAYRRPIDHFERRGISAASRILVNSAFTRFALERFLGVERHGDLEIVHPGVDPGPYANLPQLAAADDDESIVIASINRYDERKNVDLGLAAFAIALEQAPAAVAARMKLVIAGGYDPEKVHARRAWSRLVALRARLGLEHRVALLRNIEEAERLALLGRCRAVVYTPSDEHFGYGVVEAMMAGRPVVACRSGGPTEIVLDGGTGFLCDPTPNRVAGALSRLITEPELAARLGRRSRVEALNRFSRSSFGARIQAVVARVAADREPPPVSEMLPRRPQVATVFESFQETGVAARTGQVRRVG
jgi:alpha-1,3/alpha-1,6-mannosyltransferase